MLYEYDVNNVHIILQIYDHAPSVNKKVIEIAWSRFPVSLFVIFQILNQ